MAVFRALSRPSSVDGICSEEGRLRQQRLSRLAQICPGAF